MSLPGGVPSAHIDQFARTLLPAEENWPEFLYTEPHLNHYADHINAAEHLIDNAIKEGFSDKVALYYEDSAWTYKELFEKANRIARVLVEDYGLESGNRVLMRSANCPMLVACWLAVLKAGGICVTTMALLRAKELTYIANHIQADFALCESSLSEEMDLTLKASQSIKRVGYFSPLGDSSGEKSNLDEAIKTKTSEFETVKTAADDIALITFTSGTTGNPKAAAQFHRDIMATSDSVPKVFTVEKNDILCTGSSMAFTYGLSSAILYPLYYRATSVVVSAPIPDKLLGAIEKHGVTSIYLVPTLFRAILEEIDNYDVSSLAKCSSAGENLPVNLWDQWFGKTGIRLVNGIGATEFMSHFLSDTMDVAQPGSCGKAIPGYKVAVLDDEGNELPPGNRGLIAIKGPTGCRYLGDEERQKSYVRNGWNITNDIFDYDENGYLWFVDRADDLIVSSGYNVTPQEVEVAIMQHPDVKECAVVGVADEKRGKVVQGCVILNDGAQPDEAMVKSIQDHVKGLVAPYKYPRIVKFYSELPRTATGKLQRYKLTQP